MSILFVVSSHGLVPRLLVTKVIDISAPFNVSDPKCEALRPSIYAHDCTCDKVSSISHFYMRLCSDEFRKTRSCHKVNSVEHCAKLLTNSLLRRRYTDPTRHVYVLSNSNKSDRCHSCTISLYRIRSSKMVINYKVVEK